MSLAVLKRKTEAKYKNSSVGGVGFSLNGKYRNQGYVGQGSLGRSLLPCTLSEGVPKVVHKSVLSNRGMLAERNPWVNREYLEKKNNVGPQYLNSQSTYLEYKKHQVDQEMLACGNANDEPIKGTKQCKDVSRQCNSIVQSEEELVAKSQGELIEEKKRACLNIKEGFYHTRSGGAGIIC